METPGLYSLYENNCLQLNKCVLDSQSWHWRQKKIPVKPSMRRTFLEVCGLGMQQKKSKASAFIVLVPSLARSGRSRAFTSSSRSASSRKPPWWNRSWPGPRAWTRRGTLTWKDATAQLASEAAPTCGRGAGIEILVIDTFFESFILQIFIMSIYCVLTHFLT